MVLEAQEDKDGSRYSNSNYGFFDWFSYWRKDWKVGIMTREEEAIKTLQELWRETENHWYEETYSLAIKVWEHMLSTDATEDV